jgi:sec-independent protein translocase protein TatA
LIILIVVLLLFGPKKLPELARGLGRSIQEFKKAADDVKKELNVQDAFKEK